MKTYTIEDIRDLQPCYDPNKWLPENWEGTVVDILDHPEIPPQDKIWVVRNWIDDRTLRLFAVWCAREALKLISNPDPRSVEACNVAERFANGEATSGELAATAIAATYAATAAATANSATTREKQVQHLRKML